MRAQFWSFDVIFAMVIFGTSLTLLTYVWYNTSNQYSLAYGLGVVNMQSQLKSLQYRLLLPGSPSNWNSMLNASNSITWSNISIGLGTENGNAVSVNKVMALLAFSSFDTTTYQETKSLLGVGYDYYIHLSSSNISIAIGKNPVAYNAITIQTSDLSVMINGRHADLQLELWTNTTLGVG